MINLFCSKMMLYYPINCDQSIAKHVTSVNIGFERDKG